MVAITSIVDHATISLLVLGVAAAAPVWNRLPVGAVGILSSAGLWRTAASDRLRQLTHVNSRRLHVDDVLSIGQCATVDNAR